MSPRHLAFVLLFAAGSLAAQGYRCSLLGRHHQHASYCDVTGHVAPNGKEYALLATVTGTAVIDCSQPQAPVERAFFAWAASAMRSVQVYGTTAYVVSGSGAGLQVIHLDDPDQPTGGGVIGGQYFTGASSICIDQSTGRIYCVGTNAGVVVFDARGHADSPAYLGTWLDGTAGNLVAQMTAQQGTAFVAAPNAGQLRLFDLATWPPTLLSSTPTPGGCTAAAAVDAAGGLCGTFDACAGGVLQCFDSSNRLGPARRGQFTPALLSIPGRGALLADYCHLAWHSEGYRCVDLHDPDHPVEVAYYDTLPGPAGGSSGAVACFPFLPSGNVFVADSLTGLYVLRPQLSHLALNHTPISTQGEAGPYRVRVQVSANSLAPAVSLTWQAGAGLPSGAPMLPTGGNEYGCDIPGLLAPTVVSYHITASDGIAQRRLPASGELQFFVGAVRQLFADGFESQGSWTHGALTGVDEWQIGAPQGRYGASAGVGWADPPAAFAGANVAGLDLGGPGSDGAYADRSSSWLQSPAIATGGAQRLHLRYRRWLSLAAGDTARVLVNNRVVSSTALAIQDRQWQLLDCDLSAITDTATSLTIRFELNSDATGVAGGFQLDDVEVYWLSDQLPPDHYGAGVAGSGAFVPDLDLRGDWHLGTTADVQAGHLLGDSICALLVSVAPANLPVLGIPLLVQPNLMTPLLALTSDAVGPGAGAASFQLPIPNSPPLDNMQLFTQVLVLDSGAPGGLLSCSDGMHFRICAY